MCVCVCVCTFHVNLLISVYIKIAIYINIEWRVFVFLDEIRLNGAPLEDGKPSRMEADELTACNFCDLKYFIFDFQDLLY